MASKSQDDLSPAVERVPTEVWQTILLRLDYFSLKIVQRVCKTWNELIQTPAFDSLLFKSPPPSNSQLASKSPILIHPVLKQLDLIANSVKHIKLSNKLYKSFTIVDYDFASSEMATSPSYSALYLGGFGYGGTVKSKKGVTIKQVLHKIVDLWNSPTKHDYRGYELSEYDDLYEDQVGRTCIQMLFYRDDVSPDFSGFLSPTSKDGVISLIAAPFGGGSY